MSEQTETKPCWFCGSKPYRYHDGDDSAVYCDVCDPDARVNVKEWNSAWGYKELEKRDQQIKELTERIRE